MIAVETMITKLEEGCDKITAATFAYTSTAFPMLTGTLVTVAGFIPEGFAASSAGDIPSRCSPSWHCAGCLLVRGGAVYAARPAFSFCPTRLKSHGHEPSRFAARFSCCSR